MNENHYIKILQASFKTNVNEKTLTQAISFSYLEQLIADCGRYAVEITRIKMLNEMFKNIKRSITFKLLNYELK